MIGAPRLPGNSCDWRTLAEQLEHVQILTGIKPERRYADRGYRGHGVTETKVLISLHKRGVTRTIRRELKLRNAIEPEIGHVKNDGRLGRSYFKGRIGDAMNVLLVACGHNLLKILAWLRPFLAWIWARLKAWRPATRNIEHQSCVCLES